MAANKPPRKDPLPVFCFHVSLPFTKGAPAEGFFKSVSGLKYETESIPVKEGGVNDTTFMLVGSTKWSPLILKQGFMKDSKLLEWREQWISMKGAERVDGKITQLNTSMEVAATWSFKQGWPTKWEISEFDASKSELAIETLEITHQGIKFG